MLQHIYFQFPHMCRIIDFRTVAEFQQLRCDFVVSNLIISVCTFECVWWLPHCPLSLKAFSQKPIQRITPIWQSVWLGLWQKQQSRFSIYPLFFFLKEVLFFPLSFIFILMFVTFYLNSFAVKVLVYHFPQHLVFVGNILTKVKNMTIEDSYLMSFFLFSSPVKGRSKQGLFAPSQSYPFFLHRAFPSFYLLDATSEFGLLVLVK